VKFSALTASFAIGAVITAMMAMREQDPGMRAMLVALTSLEIGLAVATAAVAVAKAYESNAIIPIAGVAFASAFVISLIAMMALVPPMVHQAAMRSEEH